jgi:hypothetical protein
VRDLYTLTVLPSDPVDLVLIFNSSVDTMVCFEFTFSPYLLLQLAMREACKYINDKLAIKVCWLKKIHFLSSSFGFGGKT